MPLLILAVFIIVPVVEIAVFIELGGRIGLWNTIALIVLTAVIGTALLRSQGLRTLERARQSLENHVFPVAELFDGLCLLVAGALLLTPGFVTDAAGFLLFLPPLRALLRLWIWRLVSRGGGTRVWVMGEEMDLSGRGSGTIDGEFHEVRPDNDERNPRLPR